MHSSPRDLAAAIIDTQIAGDFVNLLLGGVVEAVIGIAVAGAVLGYLLKQSVRSVFRA
jgi:hypothetical protein